MDNPTSQQLDVARKNHALLGATPIIANMLAGMCGIEVTVGGNQAFAVPTGINLPMLDPYDIRMAIYALGYTVHESAHMKYTDFAAKETCKTPLQRSLRGAFEDIFIERRIMDDLPGVRTYLDELMTQLVSDGSFEVPSNDSEAEILHAYVLTSLRARFLNQSGLVQRADTCEEMLKKTFSTGVVTRLEALLSEVSMVRNSYDNVALAGRIVTMIKEEAKKEDEKSQQIADDKSSQSSPEQGQQPALVDDATSGDSDSGDDAPQSADGDSSGDDKPQDDDINSGDISNSDGDGDKSDAMSVAPGDDSGSDDDNVGDMLRQLIDTDTDSIGDIGDIVKDVLQTQAAKDPSSITIAAKEPALENALDSDIAELDNKAREGTHALRTRLSGLIAAQTRTHKRVSRRGNRLCGRHLCRTVTNDPRIFRNKSESHDVDTAGFCLLDVSGSMNGEELFIAREAVLSITQAFEELPDATIATAAFPGINGAEFITPLTGFNETTRKTLSRYASLRARGMTPMANALWYAMTEIAMRPEKRKLVFVITDGGPNSGHIEPCRDLIESATRSGIEVIGIGINTMSVNDLFPVSRVIKNASELAPAMFDMLQKILVNAA